MKTRLHIPILLLLVAGLAGVAPASAAPQAVVCGGSVVCVQGLINADVTWDSSNVYVLTGDLTLSPGVHLTVPAGTVVKSDGYHRQFFIDGQLTVSGADAQKVYFTSVKDDSVGGNTDNDTASPAAGDWVGLHFRTGSSGAITYAEFRYGGSSFYPGDFGMIHMEGGSVAVDHSVFSTSEYAAITCAPGQTITLTNEAPADFTFSAFNGIGMNGGTLLADTTWSETEVPYIILDDLTVNAGAGLTWGPGIIVKMADYTSLIVDGALTGSGASGAPVIVTSVKDDTAGGDTDSSANAPAAGDWKRIHMRPSSTGAFTYTDFRYGGAYISSTGNGMLYVEKATVSVDHGHFAHSDEAAISADPAHEVTLSNVAPADFTGSAYNGLGMRGEAVAGSVTWDETEVPYILLGDLTVNVTATLTWAPGTIIKMAQDVEVDVDGTFNLNGDAAHRIYVTSVKDDSIGGDTDSSGNPPDKGDWERIYYRDGSQGSLAYAELRYGGTDFYPGDYGMLHTDDTTVTVDHSKFVSSQYAAISCDPLHPVILTNVTPDDFTGSMYNALGIRGQTIFSNVTWNETVIPYVILGDLTVDTGVTLTWTPGMIVKLDYNQVVVKGTLKAEGTPAQKIYITSTGDDTVGGDTDSSLNAPHSGEWKMIHFLAGSHGSFQSAEVRYGGQSSENYGAIHVTDATVSFLSGAFYKNLVGLSSEGAAAQPVIHQSTLTENVLYAVYNGTAGHWIDATGNWWNSDQGPDDPTYDCTDGDCNPNYTADQVNDYVHYRPWRLHDHAVLNLSASLLVFNYVSGGSAPASQDLAIANTGVGGLTWTASSSAAWLQASGTSGAAPFTLHVSVNPASLAPGVHTATLTITAAGAQNSPQVVTVMLVVRPPGTGPNFVFLPFTSNR